MYSSNHVMILQKCELTVPYLVIKVVTVLWPFVNMF